MNFGTMTMILLVVAVILAVMAWRSSPSNHGSTIPYSYFFQQLEKDRVASVTFHSDILTGTWKAIPTETPEGFTG